MRETVVFGFDGVVTTYENGWQGDSIINDKPVQGIREALIEINKKYKIVVLTSRCNTESGKKAVIDWLNKYDIPYDNVTNIKPEAKAYIDNNVISFNGNSSTLLEKIESLESWTDKITYESELILTPGDVVKFKMFDAELEGHILCEYKILSHEDLSFENEFYYRIFRDLRIYDIPRKDIIEKVEV